MIPEERFNKEVWFVLEKIKKASFYAKEGGDIEYRVYSPPKLSAEGMPFPVEETKIINKLVEWGAIVIKEPNDRLEMAEVELSVAMKKLIVIRYLAIKQPKFEEVYEDFKNRVTATKIAKGAVKFDQNKAALIVDGEECQLPPNKNEYSFCRSVFNHLVGALVSWDEVYEEISGREEPRDVRKDKRMVYDTCSKINKRVERAFGIKKLFIFKNDTIRRTQ